ncbi:fibrinogen-like protein 1 [Mytilus trossulus]|uniref:fibrinogen-like protein 1 n=1 Tax=Mytilus trossulus TaxID=6551 RepID=UPI0030074F56
MCQTPLFCKDTYYWDGLECSLRKTIKVSCNVSMECADNLHCKGSLCDCKDIEYWNGSRCETRKNVSMECLETRECQQTLYCARDICQCPATDFWNGSLCVLKTKLNGTCESPTECGDTLQCTDNVCVCCETDYWDGKYCVKRKGYNSLCSNHSECMKEYTCTNNCVCFDTAYWNGHTCVQQTECEDVQSDWGGVYIVRPIGSPSPVKVYCVIKGSEKWTVIQRRQSSTVNFYRGWSDYKSGFGDVEGNHWLGNDNIHYISSSGPHELRVELKDWNGLTAYAEYSTLMIGDESSKYVLAVGGYSGTAGDSLQHHNGYTFQTKDVNTGYSTSCQGAWWYAGSCSYTNLNGQYTRGNPYYGQQTTAITWYHWKSQLIGLKETTMMIRRK